MHVVNAGAVYPQTPLNTGYFEKADAGIGIGFTFRQACGEAILSLFAHEALKRIATREANLFEIEPDSLPDSNVNLRYLRNCFGHLNRTFRMLAFTHEGSGSVVLAFSPEEVGNPERIAVGTAAFFQPAAVAALTASAALEYGPAIRVNAVSPGMIRTTMTAPWFQYMPDQEERFVKGTPVGRVGEPEDIADVVVFLCSDLARFITGQNIVVDGGLTLHGSGVDTIFDRVFPQG